MDCTAIREFLVEILGDLLTPRCMGHVFHIVCGMIIAGTSGYARSARAYVGTGLSVRSLIKRYFRLCNNSELSVDEISTWAIAFMLRQSSGLPRVVVAMDWSDVGNYSMLVTGFVYKRRCIPVLWSSIPWYGDHCEAEDKALADLERLLICETGQRCIILADRGFANGRIVQRISQMKDFSFVIRLSSTISIRQAGTKNFTSLARIEYDTGIRPQDFGFVELNKSAPCLARVVRLHRPDQVESWTLATDLDAPATTVCSLYALRFLIEETFRDLKDARSGFKLSKHIMKCPLRLSRLFGLTTMAYILLTVVGLGAESCKWNKRFQSNGRSLELAPFRLGRLVLLDDFLAKQITPSIFRKWQSRLALRIGNWDWSPRPHEVLKTWKVLPKSRKSTRTPYRRTERECDRAFRLRLRQILAERSIRHKDLAEMLDRSNCHVSAVLNGHCGVPRHWIGKLTTTLGLTTEELIGDTKWCPSQRKGSRNDRVPVILKVRARKATIPTEKETSEVLDSLDTKRLEVPAKLESPPEQLEEQQTVTIDAVASGNHMVPDRLKAARIAANCTQVDLAAAVKTHQGNISRWESGKCPIPSKQAAALEIYLKLPTDYLNARVGQPVKERRPLRMACPNCACSLAVRHEKTREGVRKTLIPADIFGSSGSQTP